MKKRSEVNDKYKIDVTEIFKTDDAYYNALEEWKKTADLLFEYKGNIGKDGKNLFTFLELDTKSDLQHEKVIIYSQLAMDINIEDKNAAKKRAQFENALEYVKSKTSYIVPELMTINFKKLSNECKELKLYKKKFEDLTRQRKHILSDREEEILALSKSASNTNEIFIKLDDNDADYGLMKDENGKEIKLTKSEYSILMQSHNQNIRKEAFEKVAEHYKKHTNTYASIYKGVVKQNFFTSKVRNYKDPFDKALFSDHMPKKLMENLIQVSNDNVGVLHKYYKVLKRILKLAELHSYDLRTNFSEKKIIIPYETAEKGVIEAVSIFGEDYQKEVKKALEENYIDVFPTENKKYCGYEYGGYELKPYIFYNYNDDVADARGLAHELGHAMHDIYSKKQPYIYFQYSHIVAEISSLTNEIIYNNYMMEKSTDKLEKIEYLKGIIQTYLVYFFNVIRVFEFEYLLHQKEQKGISLTTDEMNNTWEKILKRSYGDIVIGHDLAKYTWPLTPHIFSTSFYMYRYATCLCVATSVVKRLLNGDGKMKDQYLKFISSGSSKNPFDLIKDLGVDITNKQTIKDVVDYFEDLVEQLDNMTK